MLKSSIGPEKYRRTRKELTNESEKFAKSLKWPDTFIVEKYRNAKNLLNVSEKKRKELIIIAKNLKWPGTFIIEKFRTAKSLSIESEKKCKELKMTGHFYCEKFRRTCKELTNESENDRSLFIVKKYRRT